MGLVMFGCATQETPQQRAARIEPMLSAAGFHVNAADTPEKYDALSKLTPFNLKFYPHNGKLHYWFADPLDCRCIFIGTQQNYDNYQQIRMSQQAAQEQEEAARMNEDAAQQEQMNFMMWPDPYFY